ncbi:YgiT-type zinc finger protein [Alkalihalophilus marmarensis]|uniref:YgiT-type zinc finger protein n=1 Tax=Alkalihalophilus marmarensis TaxID=521377 RepID=UPI002DB592DD|nr:YgiT-type zinc finger protein [Alkalihalophilus marmarensis]MEC2071364.1 YgiT-type zinc finger protein [Alkalihalophilus marmarensis]
MKTCPICKREMYEDAAEELDLDEDEVILDAFSAWVCRGCTYIEEIMEDDKND